MAQATRRREGTPESQLTTLIRAIPQEVGPNHPAAASSAREQAQNLLRMNEVLQLLQGSRPAEGQPRRALYDTAVQELGGGNRDEAMSSLTMAMAASIANLRRLVTTPSDISAQRAELTTMFNSINAGLLEGSPDYVTFEPMGNDIAALLRVAGGGPVEARIAARDQPTTTEPLPLIQMRLHDLGPIHLLTSSRDESVVTVNAASTPELDLMLGGRESALELANSIANGYAELANHPDDQARLGTAGERLYDALNSIPEGRRIRDSAGYRAAMTALSGCASGGLCNVRVALQALSEETQFNTLFNQLNNMFTISVNQRAVAIMRAGVTVRYQFDDNMDAFQEYVRGSRQGRFEPRFLGVAIGLFYEYLAMSGQLQQLRLQPGGGYTREGGQALTGTGHAMTIQPSASIGFSMWSRPVEVVLHASAGYRQWQIGANIPLTDGSTERVTVGDSGGFMGLWGAEVRLPGREGQRWRIRIERVGAGVVEATNPMAYVTISGRIVEGDTVRLRSFITPQYSYFLGQHRIGAELRPADLTWQIDRDWSLRAGIGYRYDAAITPETTDATTGLTTPLSLSHTHEVFGSAGFTYRRGVSLDLIGGWITETGGPSGRRAPTSGFGSAMLTLTPGEWFRSDRETRRPPASATVPSRTRRRRGSE